MLQKVQWTIKFVSVACLLTGCATPKSKETTQVALPKERVYHAEPAAVERAIKRAMFRYPQRVENLEAGIFETDYVKGDLRFKSPTQTTDFSSGYRYRILLRMAKGQAASRSAVKVLVTKQIELMRDFFADPEQRTSDGLEESVILYRINRELILERARQKAQDKANQKQLGT